MDIELLNYVNLKYDEDVDGFICVASDKKMSVRSKHSMVKFYEELKDAVPSVDECGGHEKSGGISFNTPITGDIIEQIAELMELTLERTDN
jgi:hypothetical protein